MQSGKNNLTRRGVCHKLEYSPYIFTEIYHGKVINFNFSSMLHLNNFKELRDKNFAMIYNHIYKRFKFRVDCTLLSDFNLYKKVESRGCYINMDGVVYTKLEDISL